MYKSVKYAFNQNYLTEYLNDIIFNSFIKYWLMEYLIINMAAIKKYYLEKIHLNFRDLKK